MKFPNSGAFRLALALLILATALYAQYAFYLASFASGVNPFGDSTIVTIDLIGWQYRIDLSRAFLESSGRLWGYNPFYATGMVESYIWVNTVPYQVLGWLLPSLSAGEILRAVYLIILLAAPLAFAAIARITGASWLSASLVAALATAYCQMGTPAGMLHPGLHLGFMACYVSALLLIATCEFLASAKRLGYIFLLAPLALMIHKQAALFCLPIALLVLPFSKSHPKRVGLLVVIGLFTIALNLFWLVPMLEFFDHRAFVAEQANWQSSGLWHWLGQLFGHFLQGGFGFALLLLLLALLGLPFLFWRKTLAYSASYLFVAAYLAAFLFWGSALPGGGLLESARFEPTLLFLLLAPAAILLDQILLAPRPIAASLLIALGLCAFASWKSGAQSLESNRALAFQLLPYTDQYNPAASEMRAWVQQHVRAEQRILFETVDGRQIGETATPYGYAFPSVTFATELSRQGVGSPYSGMILDWHVPTRFFNGTLAGKKVDAAALRQFAEALALEVVICWSPSCKAALRELEDIASPQATFGPEVEAWTFDEPASYGSPATAHLDHIEFDSLSFSGVTEPVAELRVPFHYAEGFVCEPGCQVEATPSPLANDPAWISIPKPPEKFTLRYSR